MTAAALSACAALVVAVLGVGSELRRPLLRRVSAPLGTRLAVLLASGIAGCALLVLLLGHFSLLEAWIPWALGVLGLILLALRWSEIAVEGTAAVAAVQHGIRRRPLLAVATLGALSLAGVAALGPSWATDEREYHWPGPLQWADAGAWVDADVRLVDGPALMHWLYTAAALVPANAATHLLHLLTLVMAACAAAGISRSFGVDPVPWAAATVAIPVALNSAWLASNDVAVAGFGLTAAALVVVGATRLQADPLPAARAAGLVAAAAAATKAFGAGVLGSLLVLYVGLRGRTAVRGRDAWRSLAWLALPSLLVLAGLLLRTWWITGAPLDSEGTYLAPTRDDPMLVTGAAAGRIPSILDVLAHPPIPFALPLIGQQEPWGGRIGYVLLALAPALAWSFWRAGELRRRALVLTAAAYASWMTWGLVLVKTRFHLLEWMLLAGVVVLALADAEQQLPRWRQWLRAAFALLVLLGLADSGRYILQGLGRLVA